MSPAILVASPMQIGSMPVASGSRLPAWPALAPWNSRRTRCRDAFDESPSGLSSSTIPTGMDASAAPLIIILVGGAIGGDRAIDEAGEAGGALVAVVEDELEPR